MDSIGNGSADSMNVRSTGNEFNVGLAVGCPAPQATGTTLAGVQVGRQLSHFDGRVVARRATRKRGPQVVRATCAAARPSLLELAVRAGPAPRKSAARVGTPTASSRGSC